jgi:hypothetical protein
MQLAERDRVAVRDDQGRRLRGCDRVIDDIHQQTSNG